MDLALHPRELLRTAWQRRWFFILPVVLIVGAALAVATSLPPTYRSTATILIEDQEIPDDLVSSLVNDYIDRRLETLTRRVLVTDNLLRVAERYQLYTVEREVMSPTQVAQAVRSNIGMEVISTNINDPRTGRAGRATIAFQLSFQDRDPAKAQRVTNELVSLYLQTNLEQRRATAAGTTAFLAGERQRLEQRIAQLESNLLEFQNANQGLLPNDVALAQQQIIRMEQDLRQLDRESQTLREREAFLQTQLAMTDEYLPRDMSRGVTPESRLELTRAELASAQARYQPNHPDVLRLQREVRSLEAVVGTRGGGGAELLIGQRDTLQAELAALRERYTETHPDVVRVQRQLASLEERLGNVEPTMAGSTRSPAYVQLSSQLNSVLSQVQGVAQQRELIRADLERLGEVVAQAPVVSQEYERLRRALEEAILSRESLVAKEATAQLGQSLETGAVGERLSLIEPPVFPESPASPNRRLILALGLVVALGSGVGSVTLAELLDRTVRSARDLSRLIGEKPLVMIPTMISQGQRRRRWAMRAGIVGLVVAGIVAGLAVIHQRHVPLDVLAFQAQTRANAWIVRTFPGGAPTANQE